MKIRMLRTGNSLKLKLNFESILLGLATVYFLETILLISQSEIMGTLLDLVQLVLMMGLGLLFAMQRVSVNNMLMRIGVLVIFAVSTLASGVFPYLKYALVLLTGMHCEWDSAYKKLLKMYFWYLMITLLLGWTGILPSQEVRRGYLTYGFVHANTSAQYAISILSCYVMTHHRHFRGRHYLVMITAMIAVWIVTDSRTTILCMALLMVLCLMGHAGSFFFRKNGLLYFLAILLPVLLLLLSHTLGSLFRSDAGLLNTINDALNGRLTLANQVISLLNVPLFGQKVEITLVENAYVSGLYQFGLLPMIVELLVYMYAIQKSMDSKNYGRLACLLTFAVHGLAESSTFTPFINVALLSVFSGIQRNPRRKQITVKGTRLS